MSFTSFIESYLLRIVTNLRARAGHPFQLPEYTKKSFIVRVLHKHVVLFGH